MRRRDLLMWIPAYGLVGFLAYVGGDEDGPRARGLDTDSPATDSPGTDGGPTDTPTPSDPVAVEPGETLAELDAWDVLDGTASAAGACSEASGETCLHLEGGPERTRIARRFERPRDLTGVRPSAALRASEDTYPLLQLFDVDGDELRLRAPVRGGLDYQSFNFGVDGVEGEPDLSRIVEIRFNQGGSPTVWLGPVEFHEPLPPTVLVAFDDRFVANHPDVRPLLREHGYPATVFVNTGSVGGEESLTVEDLRALERADWDVCNHTVDHDDLLELDEDGQRQQIVGGRRWLISNGFETGADYVAYPYSNYDQTSIDIVERWSRLAFAGGSPAAGALPNRQLVPLNAVEEAEAARRMIDLTARFGGVTCLFYDDFDDAEREFQRAIEHLHQREAAGDVTVATASDLGDLLEP